MSRSLTGADCSGNGRMRRRRRRKRGPRSLQVSRFKKFDRRIKAKWKSLIDFLFFPWVTVSSTYKRDPYTKPAAPPRPTKDQLEFHEALGTLARRRKYTFDNSSRYSSSLTVNGDPARMYNGSPQDTTTSIMGDLTPKPPVRRCANLNVKTRLLSV